MDVMYPFMLNLYLSYFDKVFSSFSAAFWFLSKNSATHRKWFRNGHLEKWSFPI